MNSLNTFFLKVLFLIVVLILIIKSYNFYCSKENFSDKIPDRLFIKDPQNNTSVVLDNIDTKKSIKISHENAVYSGINYIKKNQEEEALHFNGKNSQLTIPNVDVSGVTIKFIYKQLDYDQPILFTIDENLHNNIRLIHSQRNKLTLIFGDSSVSVECIENMWNFIQIDINDVECSLKVNFNKESKTTNFNRRIKHIVFGKSITSTQFMKGYISSIELSNQVYLRPLSSSKHLLLNTNNDIKLVFNNVNKYSLLKTLKNETKMALLNGINGNIYIPDINDTFFSLQFYLFPLTFGEYTLISSKSGSWSIKVNKGKITVNILNYTRTFNEFNLRINKYYNFYFGINTNSYKLHVNSRFKTVSYPEKYNITKDITLGCSTHSSKYEDFFKGYIGNITYYKNRFLDYDQICQNYMCTKYIRNYDILSMQEQKRMQFWYNKSARRLVRIKEQQLLDKKNKPQRPIKINLIVKTDNDKIKLHWIKPENIKLDKYVIIMKQKINGTIKEIKSIGSKLSNNNEVTDMFFNKKINYDVLPKQFFNYKVFGRGKNPEIYIKEINKKNNMIVPVFEVRGGYDFDTDDIIVLKSDFKEGIDDYTIQIKTVGHSDNWSNPFIFTTKNNDTHPTYTFDSKKLNKEFKYKFAVIAVDKNFKIENSLNIIIDDEDYVSAEFEKQLNPNKDSKIWDDKIVCNADGTHDVFNVDENTNLKCDSTNTKSNIGYDHFQLSDYLKSEKSKDIGIEF